MQTEQLRHVRPSWVAFGWFISAAVAGLIILALIALRLVPPDTTEAGGFWIPLALLLGFVAGGFFTGWRTVRAPILHGAAIGLFTLVVWLLANLLPGEATGWTAWRELPSPQAFALLFLITIAAIVGARIGARWAK